MVQTGVFPAEWSEGVICPIYKKGSQKDPANYIPVFLLSLTHKVVDTAIKSVINAQFVPGQSQFGFQ